jgi:hypothetical protein
LGQIGEGLGSVGVFAVTSDELGNLAKQLRNISKDREELVRVNLERSGLSSTSRCIIHGTYIRRRVLPTGRMRKRMVMICLSGRHIAIEY